MNKSIVPVVFGIVLMLAGVALNVLGKELPIISVIGIVISFVGFFVFLFGLYKSLEPKISNFKWTGGAFVLVGVIVIAVSSAVFSCISPPCSGQEISMVIGGTIGVLIILFGIYKFFKK